MWSRAFSLRSLRTQLSLRPQGAQLESERLRQHRDHNSKVQKHFSTSTFFCDKKDDVSTVPEDNSNEKTSGNQDKIAQVNATKNVLKLIGEMKVKISSKRTLQMLKDQKIKEQDQNLLKSLDSTNGMPHKTTEDSKAKRKPLKQELVAAASAVASSLPFDKKRTVSELLQVLSKHKEATDAQKGGQDSNISNIITQMKIGRRPATTNSSRLSNKSQIDDGAHRYGLEFTGLKRKAMYKGERLNIFTKGEKTVTEVTFSTVSSPTLWDLELANKIAAVSQQPPRNGFEEMIQWTKEGKLWEFPINNEAGIEDDSEFHEHIFLDKYLEDFPKEGPIRHFMELVTCGLSKNPYLTIKEKVEHIDWFRNYFQEKVELLKEIEGRKKEIEAELEMENLSKN
uniref:Small ribosomal subunit protein mS31 n=1 Tax=Sphenodon punctatus TaxID=8508 RepID=A0A8D0HKF0_SPHPU